MEPSTSNGECVEAPTQEGRKRRQEKEYVVETKMMRETPAPIIVSKIVYCLKTLSCFTAVEYLNTNWIPFLFV